MTLRVGVHPIGQEKIERKIGWKCLVPVSHKGFQKGAIDALLLSSLHARQSYKFKQFQARYIQICILEIHLVINKTLPVSHIA